MYVEYEIVERHDARGAPVFFITVNNVEVTSRWTREDAERAITRLQSPLHLTYEDLLKRGASAASADGTQ